MNLIMLALLTLAAARATHLVTDDLYPFGPLRDRLARSPKPILQDIAYGLKCTFCVSVWSGAAAAGLALWQNWAARDLGTFVVLWWAIAGAIVIIEGIVFTLMED